MSLHFEAPLRDLAAMLRERTTSVQDLAATALEANRSGAYVALDAERVMARAAHVDAGIDLGLDVGPLQGLPVSVKDLYGLSGFPTAAGAAEALPSSFEIPGPLMQRVERQLGLVIGKTHTVEFAFGGIGTNPHHRPPRNPWVPKRAPGGSSAGAGVSIAEGSALIAFGTDTAGSCRIPAAWTGQCGLKTMKGRWSTEGIVPLSQTLDTPGVIARSVEDLAFAFEALDPSPRSLVKREVAGLRLARTDRVVFDDCSPGVAERTEEVLEELEAKGALLNEVVLPELPETLELFHQGGPVAAELFAFLSREIPGHLEALDPNVLRRLEGAGHLPAHEYLRRLDRMRALSATIRSRLSSFDAWVLPTVANSPPMLTALEDPEVYRRENLLCLRNTCFANYLGLAALTLPVGLDAVGAPVGLMLVATSEESLLSIGIAIERSLGDARARLGPPPGS